MIFKHRVDAGQKLAQTLSHYAHDTNTIIIALPRGGVVVGFEVAKELNLPLDIVCPRKIGSPQNPEYAVGAVTESGHYFLSEKVPDALIEKEIKIAQARLLKYRQKRPPRNLENKRVIIVDDGIATGSTMRAAIETVRLQKAYEIILAVPVAPIETVKKFKKQVDQVFCLETPDPFFSVGEFYESFEQTTDQEVIHKLKL